MGESLLIRTSTTFAALALSAVSCLACAKGTEISPSEIVILSALPPAGSDAGVDAGSAQIEAAPDEQVSTDTEL